jgi:hypothetical protein
VFDAYSQVTIQNSTLSGNTTVTVNGGDVGGGIYNNAGSTLTVSWSTLAENYAVVSGGGIFNDSGGTVSLFNTIVAMDTAGGDYHLDDVGGAFASQGNNLIGNGDGASGFTDADLVGTTASPIDPMLAPLAFNGGPTQTYALLAGSPAIGNGSTVNADLVGTDQRGPGFAREVNGLVDIGAFEVQAGGGGGPAPPPVRRRTTPPQVNVPGGGGADATAAQYTAAAWTMASMGSCCPDMPPDMSGGSGALGGLTAYSGLPDERGSQIGSAELAGQAGNYHTGPKIVHVIAMGGGEPMHICN